MPPAQPNWLAYHVLNRLAYGGTINQLNIVWQLTAQEARAWAIRYMKEQLELDPNRPWPTNLHNTEPLPAPIVLNDSALNQRLAADRADWRTEDGLPDVLSPSLSELQDYDLIRKVYSRRQLRGKMVYFWDNHSIPTTGPIAKGSTNLQRTKRSGPMRSGNSSIYSWSVPRAAR